MNESTESVISDASEKLSVVDVRSATNENVLGAYCVVDANAD